MAHFSLCLANPPTQSSASEVFAEADADGSGTLDKAPEILWREADLLGTGIHPYVNICFLGSGPPVVFAAFGSKRQLGNCSGPHRMSDSCVNGSYADTSILGSQTLSICVLKGWLIWLPAIVNVVNWINSNLTDLCTCSFSEGNDQG